MRILELGEHPGTDKAWETVLHEGRFLSFQPGTTVSMAHAEYQHEASIGPLGGRRVENIGKGAPVVSLGDSFTFGVGVGDGETFVDRLQNSIPGRRWINLGVPGSASPVSRFIVQQRHAELGRPRIYFQFFFLGNDFADILNLHAAEVQRDHSEASNRKPALTLTQRLNGWLSGSHLRQSYVLQYIRRGALGFINASRPASQRLLDPAFLMMGEHDEYLTRVRSTLRVEFERWQDLQEELDFELVLVLIPDRHQVLAELRKAQAAMYSIDPASLDVRRPNKLVADLCQVYGIQVIDPLPSYLDRNCEQLYYVHDNHFTRSGHEFFAAIVAERVKSVIEAADPDPHQGDD